jgi:hypothetical protein
MEPPNRPSLRGSEDARERAGLPETPGHGGIAAEKCGNLRSTHTCENRVPLLKNGAYVSSVPGHPPSQIIDREFEYSSVPAQSARDDPVFDTVDEVNQPV